MKLHISDQLTLPAEAVTQTIGILAKRRAGKSYTARRLAEQLVKAGQQIAIVDPKGDWWGIRNGADGKSPGLSIVILGGERADVPLEVGSGEVVAQLVAEERVSVLLDLSLFRKHEVATFMTAFLENLYRLKAREQSRTPLMLIVDEADAIAPQKPQENEARMLGAAEDIVRRGGQRGIGCTMITQRSAVLNKNVLTQVELLITLRTIAPQDLAAVKAWIDVHGTIEEGRTMMDSLPGLPIGDAWVWSPGWPTATGIFQRVHVLPIETYDSGATPKPGQKRVEPKNAADVDLAALRTTMAATIERAKADDPRELRKEIAGLRHENTLLRHAARPSEAKVETKRVEVPVLKEGQLARLEKMVGSLDRLFTAAGAAFGDLREIGTPIREALVKLHANAAISRAPFPKDLPDRSPLLTGQSAASKPVHTLPKNRNGAVDQSARAANSGAGTTGGTGGEKGITKAQQRILDALAWFESIGNSAPTALMIGAIAIIDSTGGHFSNVVGPLSSNGLVIRGSGTLSLTEQGRQFARLPERVATLADYHDMLRQRVRKAKSASGKTVAILDVVISRGGAEVTTEEIGREVSIDPSGGHFSNTIGPLSTLGLITRAHGIVRPTEIIFPPGLA